MRNYPKKRGSSITRGLVTAINTIRETSRQGYRQAKTRNDFANVTTYIQIESIWIRFKDWECVVLSEIDFLSKFADCFKALRLLKKFFYLIYLATILRLALN